MNDLKKSCDSIMKSYNPKGQNAESLINKIGGFHKQIETVITSLDAVFK